METPLFRMYWFNPRTGMGHPALAYPDPVDWGFASKEILEKGSNSRRKRLMPFGLELHYEPVEVFEKYTVNNTPQ